MFTLEKVGIVRSKHQFLFRSVLVQQISAHWLPWHHVSQYYIPYSGKLSREKTFVNFAVL